MESKEIAISMVNTFLTLKNTQQITVIEFYRAKQCALLSIGYMKSISLSNKESLEQSLEKNETTKPFDSMLESIIEAIFDNGAIVYLNKLKKEVESLKIQDFE